MCGGKNTWFCYHWYCLLSHYMLGLNNSIRYFLPKLIFTKHYCQLSSEASQQIWKQQLIYNVILRELKQSLPAYCTQEIPGNKYNFSFQAQLVTNKYKNIRVIPTL